MPLVIHVVSTEEEEETEMGTCATKPKVSKENENAPLTRDVEVEEKKEFAEGDVAEKEISGAGAGAEEKGEVLLKEVEARETVPSTEQIKLEHPVEDETVLAVEGKKAEESAEEAESKTTPAAAATDEELKEAKQEEAEAKAEAETEVTVVGKEEEEENRGADVIEKSSVEVETKATETQVQEISSEGKTV